MPYYDPQNRECLYSDACAGGKLRPGYRHVIGDGEAVHFSVLMRDSAPGRVTLTDSQTVTDAEVRDAYSEMVTDMTGAWKRRPGQQPTAEQQDLADAAQSPEAAYAAMVTHNCTAWQR